MQKKRISDELLAVIEETARTTAASLGTDGTNYFHATEMLLKNYKRLQAMHDDKDSYLDIELPTRSNSIVKLSYGSHIRIDPDDLVHAAVSERAALYARNETQYHAIQRVIAMFEGQKEFVVIRLYYFGEDIHGNARKDTKPYTWDDVAFELEQAGILHDVKTARRWRNKLVSDMAVCLFGASAALSVSKT